MVSSAARVGSINVLFEVQYGQAVAGADRFAGAVERGGQRMQKSVRATDRSVLGLNQTISRLNSRQFNVLALSALRASNSVDRLRGVLLATSALAGGVGAAFSLRSVVEYSDTYKTVGNRLRVVKNEAQELRDIERDIFDVAQRSRAQYEATGVLFSRIANSARRLGIAQKDVLRVTETIQKAFLVGGATPVEAAQSSIQLSQGIASNRLQGDELRSVLENPALGQLLADRITDGDIGKLRELAAQGELTAGVIINAFKSATGEIDRLFNSTEQTIGQALVKIDNALMRYIGTSGKANATSRATVELLNAMAVNFEGIADTAILVGAALATAFVGKGANAIATRVSELRALRIDQAASAAAALQQASAERIAAAQTLASTRAAYEMSKAQTVSAQTRTRFGRELQAAMARDLATTRAQVLATQQHAIAMRSASISGMAYATAGRAASAAWAFIGGPFGAALLALGGAMYLVSQRSAEAEARSDRYAEAIRRAKEESDGAAGSIRRVAEAFFKVAEGAGSAEQLVAQRQAVQDFTAAITEMVFTLEAARGAAAGQSGEGFVQIAGLIQALRNGEISAEEFREALDRIASADPGLAPVIVDLQRLGDQADAERGRIDALTQSLQELSLAWTRGMETLAGFTDGGVGTKGDRPIPALGKDEFNSRFGQPYSKSWKELFPDLYKPEKRGRAPQKTADDRFDNSVQSVMDRIEALRQEQALLGQTYYEQVRREEALKLEQEALKQVREEARRKGEQDWQNAQISAEQRAEIDQVSRALAAQATQTKYAKESQDALNNAAGSYGSLIRGLIDGTTEWKDALLQIGTILLKLLNDLNLAGGGLGLFGGGPFQALLGGLLGIAFHGGGTVGSGGSTGPLPLGAPYIGKRHSGGDIGRPTTSHREVLAALELGETVLTSDQTASVVKTMNAMANQLGGGRQRVAIEVGVAADNNGNLRPFVQSVADQSARTATGALAKQMPGMVDGRVRAQQTRGIRP